MSLSLCPLSLSLVRNHLPFFVLVLFFIELNARTSYIHTHTHTYKQTCTKKKKKRHEHIGVVLEKIGQKVRILQEKDVLKGRDLKDPNGEKNSVFTL